jgi:hypothetical protein
MSNEKFALADPYALASGLQLALGSGTSSAAETRGITAEKSAKQETRQNSLKVFFIF